MTRRPRTRREPCWPVVDRAATGLCPRLRHRTSAHDPSPGAARGRVLALRAITARTACRSGSKHELELSASGNTWGSRTSALDRPELSCVDDDADRAPGLRRQTDTGEQSPP